MAAIPLPAENRSAAVAKLGQFLMLAHPGKPLAVTVEVARKRRSDQQNAYWWGVVVATFCQHLEGWEPEDVHTYLCGEEFGWERIEGLGAARMKPLKRSSRLNTAEFAKLVATAQRIGAHHGIYIPDPDPHYWLHKDTP